VLNLYIIPLIPVMRMASCITQPAYSEMINDPSANNGAHKDELLCTKRKIIYTNTRCISNDIPYKFDIC
jgi:hypothetical protein